jgi:hypothetical protein
MTYFLLKHDKNNFKAMTLVKYESVTYSGKCYLVSDLKDTYNREWIMYYDLYKLIDKNHNNQIWNYNEDYDIKMRELISNL